MSNITLDVLMKKWHLFSDVHGNGLLILVIRICYSQNNHHYEEMFLKHLVKL